MPEPLETPAAIPAALSVDSESRTSSAGRKSPATSLPKFVGKALEEHESALLAYSVTTLGDLDRAREIVQDTFIRLCQQNPAKVETHLRSWLISTCRNRALEILGKDKRPRPLEDVRWKKFSGNGSQDSSADHLEKQERLMAYLDRLSANQREVILLKFQQGLSYQEIHSVTGLTTANIGFLIHTGLKRLRDILPDELRA